MADDELSPRLVAAFLLGFFLLNFPLLAISEAAGDLLGLPALFVYLFAAWAVVIALLALLIERAGR